MSALRDSVLGAAGFTAAAAIVFGTVAFGEARMVGALGLGGAYGVWVALFLVVATALLAPLGGDSRARRAIAVRFPLAFLAYAALWCVAWFLRPDKLGEVLGAIAGTAALATILSAGQSARDRRRGAVVLLVGNAIGYFVGDALHTALGRPLGMVLWGSTFGIGTGAPLGWIIGVPRRAAGED